MNESMKKENNKEGLYSPKGKVSLGQAVPMALQHVVAMVVGCISMPMLVAGAGGISGSEQIVMIQASLLGAAIAIFLQHYPLKGLVGSGLPVMIGSGFAFLPTLSSIVGQYGIAAMLGAQVFGAAMGIIVGIFFKYIRKLFPPIVTGSVVVTIGISLYDTAVNYMAGGVKTAADYGSMQNWLLAMITLITVIICGQFGKGMIKASSTLIGMIVGYLSALAMGLIHFDGIGEAAWFQLPQIMHFGLDFQPSAMIALGIVFVVNAVQDMGQLEASANGAFDRNASFQEISGGVIANNIASMIGGFLGGSPVATAGQNVGIVTTTKVINRTVFSLAAGIVALAALMPKFALILTTIPQPVLGGATITVFASIAMTGVRMLSREGLSPRSVFIAGLSIALAIGIPQTAGVFAGFPQWMTDIFGKSEVSIVAVSAIVLNLIVPKEKTEKAA